MDRPISTESSEHSDRSSPDIIELVARIQADDTSAMEELYRIFARGIKYQICRQLGPQDLDDKVHDCFLIVVQAIRRGELREPDRLMGFVRTVVRRQIAAYIETVIQNRKQMTDLETGRIVADFGQDPENCIIDRSLNSGRPAMKTRLLCDFGKRRVLSRVSGISAISLTI